MPAGTSTAIAVDCPSCRGRSLVDAEYRHLSQWACPFCASSNPMPPPGDAGPDQPAAESDAGDVPAPVAPPVSTQATPANHPAPEAHVPATRGEPRPPRRQWPAAIAAIVVVVAAAVAINAQSAMPRGDYRTIEGLAAALEAADIPCGTLTPDSSHAPGVRDAAVCTVGPLDVRLSTFGDAAKRDRYLASLVTSPAAVGRTWIAATDDEPTARSIARALGGRYRARDGGIHAP